MSTDVQNQPLTWRYNCIKWNFTACELCVISPHAQHYHITMCSNPTNMHFLFFIFELTVLFWSAAVCVARVLFIYLFSRSADSAPWGSRYSGACSNPAVIRETGRCRVHFRQCGARAALRMLYMHTVGALLALSCVLKETEAWGYKNGILHNSIWLGTVCFYS